MSEYNRISYESKNTALETEQSQILIENSHIQNLKSQTPEILFVWNYLEWGGAQIYFLGIMRRALHRYKVKAVMPHGTGEKLLGYFKQENVSVEFFNARIDLSKAHHFWHKARRRFRDWSCYLTLTRQLSKQKLREKIIQIDVAPWSAGFWLLFYLALRTHVFVTLHIALPDSLQNNFTKLKFRLLSSLPKFHLLASNEDMKQSLRYLVSENYWNQIPIAYTGINTREINSVLRLPLGREKMCEQYNLPKEKKLIFSLGNIIERKGFRVLLEAAKKLRFTHPELFFVWLGDGECRGEMENLIKQFELNEIVKIITPIEIGEERQNLLQLLRMADIYVHPSFAEGLPGALLEAMALGIPVIASRVNAIPEVVTNDEAGLLVEVGDVSGFAQAISKLADNEPLRHQVAKNGQRTVLMQFTEENCAEITINYYEKCWQKI